MFVGLRMWECTSLRVCVFVYAYAYERARVRDVRVRARKRLIRLHYF